MGASRNLNFLLPDTTGSCLPVVFPNRQNIFLTTSLPFCVCFSLLTDLSGHYLVGVAMDGLQSPSNRTVYFDPCPLQWLIMFTSSTIKQIQHEMVMNISHGDLGLDSIEKLLIWAKIPSMPSSFIGCLEPRREHQWSHLSGLLEASHSSPLF